MSNKEKQVDVEAIFKALEKYVEEITSSDEEELISKEFTTDELKTLCLNFQCKVALYKGNAWLCYEQNQKKKYEEKYKEKVPIKVVEKIHKSIFSKFPKLYQSHLRYEERHNKNKPKRLRCRRIDYREYLDSLENNNEAENEECCGKELESITLFSTETSAAINDVDNRSSCYNNEEIINGGISTSKRNIEVTGENLPNPEYNDLVYNIDDDDDSISTEKSVPEFAYAVAETPSSSQDLYPTPDMLSLATYTEFEDRFSRCNELLITSTQDKQIACVSRPNCS